MSLHKRLVLFGTGKRVENFDWVPLRPSTIFPVAQEDYKRLRGVLCLVMMLYDGGRIFFEHFSWAVGNVFSLIAFYPRHRFHGLSLIARVDEFELTIQNVSGEFGERHCGNRRSQERLVMPYLLTTATKVMMGCKSRNLLEGNPFKGYQ